MLCMKVGSLFPSKWGFGVFLLYIFLFVNHGVLITASQKSGNIYLYNTIVAVLLTELLKLIISIILYTWNHSCILLFTEAKKNVRVLQLYFIPAFLYSVYNNLTYTNLASFDPTTYFLILQLRVVVTGIIFQLLFKKTLTQTQWLSLLLLTFGCMLKNFHFSDEGPLNVENRHLLKESDMSWSFETFLLLLQVCCSCLAGVYNEYLLKSESTEVNVYLQNIFMYLDSIVVNFGALALLGDVSETFSKSILMPFLEPKVIFVVVNSAAIGIVTSFFLRYLDSIMKTFASAIELIFTALLSRIFFAIPIYLNTILSITFVIIATVIYSQNPVKNQVNEERKDAKDHASKPKAALAV